MRLLLATPYYAPAYAFGGSVTVAETIVEDAVAAGHEVSVVTTDVLDEHERIAPGTPGTDGAEVVRRPNVSHRLAAGVNLYLPRGMRGWLRENVGRFDVVLLHDVYSAVSVMAARAARDAGVPFALQPLGTLSPAAERGRPLAKQAFLRLWGNRTIATAGRLFHATEDERRDFLDAGAPADRLTLMPLPLDLPEGVDLPETAVPTVTYVGRLHELKGIDVLIDAVALARRDVPELRLVIVGPGERYGRQLREQADRLGLGDAVELAGFVSVEEKLRRLAEAHVSSLLSRSEGLPMGALEAMACGTPVVLSPGCHLPEVDGRAGIVAERTAEAAAAALVRLLRDDELRRRLGTGGREFAAGFRRETVMPHMLQVLGEIATSSSSRAA